MGLVVPPGCDPEARITSVECRPRFALRSGLFAVFEEFFEYQKWSTATEVAAMIREVRPEYLLAEIPVEGCECPTFISDRPRHAFGRLVSKFYDSPDWDLDLIGVTGTNGKTTTVHLIAYLLNCLGSDAGSMGTLGTHLRGERIEEGVYTTDLALLSSQRLSGLRNLGARVVSMEVSSHGLALDRVAGLRFSGAVVTNVTRDHLEFHRTLDSYVEAKGRLVSGLDADAFAVINVDDPVASGFSALSRARVIGVGRRPNAHWRLLGIEHVSSGMRFQMSVEGKTFEVGTGLVGEFQVYNLMAGMAAVWALGHEIESVIAAVPGFHAVEGRMEVVKLSSGGTVVIDFAHNPDGIESLLKSCRSMAPEKLLLVFGCGGDRDAGKRPLMGAIAEQFADRVWVTSDNPRTEDPRTIIQQILQGMSKPGQALVEMDRASAIRQALAECGKKDILVIAGKGHEKYQIIGTEKLPFSDRLEIESWMAGNA